jgi:GNAT superfamily N-acetyltransferase
VEKANSYGKSVIEPWTNQTSGKRFLEKYGATLSITGFDSRLELEDVDWDLMKSWVEEGKKRAKGVTIKSFNKCPEDIIDEFTAMITEAGRTQPQGDTDYKATFNRKIRREWEEYHEKMDCIRYTLIAMEKDGRLSGHTEIAYYPSYPEIIFQRGSGVRPEFRGEGRGKMLKAAMLLYIKDNYPKAKKMTVSNAEVNAAILSINKRIGFRKYKSHAGYKFEVEELAEKLGL